MHAITLFRILADQGGPEAGVQAAAGLFGFLFFVMCGGFLFVLGIQFLFGFLAYKLLSAVPQPFRKQEPKMAFLLMIPIFALIWNFFVWPRISQSYAEYFKAQNRIDVGDAGGSLALAYCICAVAIVIPYLGWGCLSVVSFILLIIYLVKMFGLKAQIKP